jgi:acyl-CoA synthetase (AMP-forming)/AMP-acid ligase II
VNTTAGVYNFDAASVNTSLIRQLLETAARARPDSPAILALDRPPLSFHALLAHIHRQSQTLQQLGLKRNCRIAAVLPDGPASLSAFLAVSCVGTFAPLNPACRATEFEFYLDDLKPCALLVEAGSDIPAVLLARARKIPVIELIPCADEAAGVFNLSGDTIGVPATDSAQSDDDALLLYTSGTTSKPKLVPLTHTNITAAVSANCKALMLQPDDCCLNVMPLFHIHGLVASALTALSAGSSVVCPPAFNPRQFEKWLNAFDVTWYSASAALHYDIVEFLRNHGAHRPKNRLRFIRVGSTAIATRLVRELEDEFKRARNRSIRND